MSRVRDSTTKETHKSLIDAVNLLGNFVDANLPPFGWQIKMTLGVNDGCLQLIDPSGQEVATDSPDHGISSFADMCDVAWEIEDMRPDPEPPEGYHDEPEPGPQMRDGIVY